MSTFTLDNLTTTQAVTNAHLVTFAETHINLPPDLTQRYRDQAKRVREQLKKFIAEHPDYDLVKMLHSGSLAKGTALRDINDIDTAIYVRASELEDKDNAGLIAWLLERLQEVYPGFGPDQLIPHDHCVTVVYKTPGYIPVDVVPVLYEGDEENRGYLIRKDGKRVLTSISLHIKFVQARKQMQPHYYAQFVRLVKWWIAQNKTRYKSTGGHFRFKSMIAELICAKLIDAGLDTSNYPEALLAFFGYIVQSELKEPIYFTDYYAASKVNLSGNELMKIFDPVNPENNIASTYTEAERLQIVQEATVALEAIATANHSTTKGEAVAQWQRVLGRSFVGQL